MSYADYIILGMCCLTLTFGLIVGIWRITCYFKKSCTWKNCPYRHHYHPCKDIGWLEIGCDKFPPTQEEIDEREARLDRLEAMIKQMSQERKKPEK